MIIALLIALVFGGSQEDIVFTHLEKYYKKNFEKGEQKEKLKILFSEYNSQKKLYDKANKARMKRFQKLQASPNSTSDNFDSIYTEAVRSRKKWQQASLTRLSILKENLTEDQWNEALQKTDKDVDKYWKSYAKGKSKIINKLEKTDKKIASLKADEKTKEEASDMVRLFRSELEMHFTDFQDKDPAIRKAMLQYSTTNEVILRQKNELHAIQNEFYQSFQKTYFDLKEALGEQDWTKVKSSLNAIL